MPAQEVAGLTEAGAAFNRAAPAFLFVILSGLQRPGDLVSTEDDAGRKCFRADELERECRGSLREEALPRAQQYRIDGQQDFIREPMFEQRRCQRGATPEDNVGAVLRLDAADALDDVRSK